MKKSKFLKSSKDILSRSFNPSKCKTSLKLAASRLKLFRNKKEAQVKQMRREISVLLESGQDHTARLRVEHVIREEKMMAAFDLIEIYCELIVVRLSIIESQKTCPIDLKEAITSVVFASLRFGDVPELVDVKKQFTEKYGKEFITSAVELRPDCGVNRMLVEKLSAVAPDIQTKTKFLNAIAKEHNVEWKGESIEENTVPVNDLLNGPSTFVKVNEQPVEPSHFQDPNIQVSQSTPLDRRTTMGTERLVSSQVSGVSTAFQHETRPDASGGEMEYRRDHNNVTHDRPKWNMEFKDATAAAQAAAESAERASMAARAAAELSRRESYTRQHSMESNKSDDRSPRNQEPDTYPRSKMDGGNRSFYEHSRMRNEQIDRVNLSNTGGRYDASRDDRKEYSHSSSFQSNASGDYDSTERYHRKDSVKEDSRSERSMERQSENAKTIKKQEGFISSHSPSGTSNNANIFSHPDQHFEYGAAENSSLGFGKVDIREETSPKSSHGSAAVFDKSDSDTENDGFHKSPTYDEPQQEQVSLSSYWSSSPKSSTRKIVQPPASISVTRKSSSSDMYGSRLDDSVPVAFDQSDGPTSESEDDTELSRGFFSDHKKSVHLLSKDKNGPSVRSQQNSSTQFDDESDDTETERYQRKKFDVDPSTEITNRKSTVDTPATVPKKNQTESSTSGFSSPEREGALNFGKLTGGFRQKGYNYPSFGKNQVDVSPSKKESRETSDTFAKATPDIDSSEEEEPLQKGSDHKHKLSTLGGGRDLKTKPSFVASDSVFSSENSDSDEDVPMESPSRTRRLLSGISRRTKAISSNHEKEKLSNIDDGMYRKATTSTSYGTPKRYEAKEEWSRLEVESPKPENSTSGGIQKSKAEPTAQPKLQWNSSQLRNSDRPSSSKVAANPTISNSRGSLQQEISEKANSPLIQESKPQTKIEPSTRKENPKTETLSKTNSNKDSGNEKPSHVHPKLPDYDNFVQFFQKNRS